MSSRADLRVRSGFTLIELLVVIAIIGLLAALVGPEVLRSAGTARSESARAQIEMISLALDGYRLDNHLYPTTEQGLAALRSMSTVGAQPPNWRGPYLRRSVPMDPWGREYLYVAPGRAEPSSYDLYTLGRDGAIGGSDEDEDITSWGGAVAP